MTWQTLNDRKLDSIHSISFNICSSVLCLIAKWCTWTARKCYFLTVNVVLQYRRQTQNFTIHSIAWKLCEQFNWMKSDVCLLANTWYYYCIWINFREGKVEHLIDFKKTQRSWAEVVEINRVINCCFWRHHFYRLPRILAIPLKWAKLESGMTKILENNRENV